jgi:macrolide-specific efflux system membrane fusion protein
MTAQVYIVLDKVKDAVLVPSAALRQGKGGETVQVVKGEGEPEVRKVKVGIDNNINAQILEGLEVGERVVIGSAQAGEKPRQSQQQRMPRMRF